MFFRNPTYSPLVLIASLALAAPCAYAKSAGTQAASFLDIPVGAGPAALAGAYTARATDAYAPVWNPAGLGHLASTELTGMYAPYLVSTRYNFLSVAVPFLSNSQGFGASVQYLTSGDIEGRDEAGLPAASYSTTSAAYTLAYGARLNDRLSLGTAFKSIRQTISDVKGNAYALDAGVLFQAHPRLMLGATLVNAGSKLKMVEQEDDLPTAVRTGLAWIANESMDVSIDGVARKEGPLTGSIGVEYKYFDQLSLRVGYDTAPTKEQGMVAGVRGGLSVYYKGQEFSYAAVPFGQLGFAQYLSLVFRFTKQPMRNRPNQDASSETGVFEDFDDYKNLQDVLNENERKSLWSN